MGDDRRQTWRRGWGWIAPLLTLQSLALHAEEPDVVEYLKEPLDQMELVGLLKKMGVPAHDLLRTKEDEYDELGLSPDTPEEDILTAIAAHPILLERPIVVKGRRAVIARPPELVEELL